MSAPVLRTARLVLRGHRAEDFADVAALWSDAAVMAAGGFALSAERESWQRLLRYAGLWPVLGYGYWAAREASSGRFVGDVGFADFHREVTPSIRGVPEAGWVLAQWAWGQGFAAEAMAAGLSWLERESVCLINPNNAPSLRLASRLSYGAPVQTLLNGDATLLLTRPHS